MRVKLERKVQDLSQVYLERERGGTCGSPSIASSYTDIV